MDATTVKATTSVLSAVATLAVVGRFWARTLKKQQYGIDDWTILASMLIMWALAAVTLRGALTGLYDGRVLDGSRTEKDLGKAGVEQLISKYNFVKCVLLIAGLGSVKLSVVFLYRRIFNIIPSFRLYSIGLIVLLACWTVGFLGANIFQCGLRFWALWGSADAAVRYCKAAAPASYGFVVSDIITDVLVLIAPVPVIWHMHLPTAKKVAIIGSFALGTVSTGAACGRIYTFVEARRQQTPPWQMESELAVWAVIELACAVLAGCLPVMRPLLRWKALSEVSTIPYDRSHQSAREEDGSWIEIRKA